MGGLPTTGAGSDPALFACSGVAESSEQGWSVGNPNPNLETRSLPGGTSLWA